MHLAVVDLASIDEPFLDDLSLRAVPSSRHEDTPFILSVARMM